MSSPQQPIRQPFERFYRTLRLTFAYEGSSIHLTSRQSVDMLTPPSNASPIRQGQSGFWYELRDREGKVLYQRAIYNPIRFEEEIFPEDHREPIRRMRRANPRGTFDVLVPDIPEGDTVVLFSSPLEPERSAEAASELARFSLK
jgi:hypothetical protein